MSLKSKEVEIDDNENPFANCKLDRQKYAEVLTNIVKTYKDGFVLAINNEWGTGKTTFLKMWKQHLENKGYKTVYLNAWENDFESNPIVPILACLDGITNKNDVKFKSILGKATILGKNLGPVLAKSIVSKYMDLDEFEKGFDAITKASISLLESEVKSYNSKVKSISQFKSELTTFVKEHSNDKSLVFMIDELDRCRPNYAVEILEYIKHFFSVEGIVFVLSIDKVQLAHAVCGVYNNSNINSIEYLKRFIDLEYSIPEPSSIMYCEYLYDSLGIDSLMNKNPNEFHLHKNDFVDFFISIIDKHKFNLRTQYKIFSLFKLVLLQVEIYDHIKLIPSLLIMTIYKVAFEFEYKKIKDLEYDYTQLISKFEFVLPNNLNIPDKYFCIKVIAQLYLLYNYEKYGFSKMKNEFENFNETKMIHSVSLNIQNMNEDFLLMIKDTFRIIDVEFKLSIILKYIEINNNFVFAN